MNHSCWRAFLRQQGRALTRSSPLLKAREGSCRRVRQSHHHTSVGSVRSMSAHLPTPTDTNDPREWLENVEAEEALGWVREQNAQTISAIGTPSSKPIYDRILQIMDSKEKIPYIGRVLNGLYYNFWQDDQHVRGIWRRCSLESYRQAEPAWELVLDVDALGEAENVSWVWGGSTVLDEGTGVHRDRVMIRLSRGGSDASVAREFDLDKKCFVSAEEGGFILPEAKSRLCYKDRNTLIVGGVFGEEEMTDSGYPLTVRVWTRGTPLSSAVKTYKGEKSDVSVSGLFYLDHGRPYEMRMRSLTFYTSRYELWMNDDFVHIPIPADAQIGTFGDQLLITLRTAWMGHAAGSLLAAPVEEFMASGGKEEVVASLLTPIFTPTETCSLEGDTSTKSYLILYVLDNVVTELRFWRYHPESSSWVLERTLREEGLAQPSASPVEGDESDSIWITTSGYTRPTSLYLAEAESPDDREPLKALPAFFDASNIKTSQLFATSEDGTSIPYFVVSREDIALDGSTPTLLYGYGGFEISLKPQYSANVGAAWLEKGYTYVVANIRGGGEFGPAWHQSALKEKRNKAYEDFEAVAKDLVARGYTCPSKLGCQGGSNGGLLVGNMLARSPALFGAIVCQVPLLDMRRFHLLLAGASWMGEYGNPDKEWDFLQLYSPYHNINEATAYPPVLFTTSTRDDRVHPGHARKVVHKMIDMKKESTYYYENIEGGHGGAADNKQRAFMSTLAYEFLEKVLAKGDL